MMRLTYDLHLHSCLSPCGDADMTPYNLVNMAALLGLDVIALTDHNTSGNCRAAIQAGESAGVLVLPGLELCTAEEIHVICLFGELPMAEAFSDEVKASLPPVKNRPAIYGRQLFMDAENGVLGEEERLLITASSFSIDSVSALVEQLGGVSFPAHIDRASYSLLSVFGGYPDGLGFSCAELSQTADEGALRNAYPLLNNLLLLQNSDAHSLGDMREPQPRHLLHAEEKTAAAVIRRLRQGAAQQ